MIGGDRGELIKWYDVQEALPRAASAADVELAMQRARECRHPDAQWLAALFPAGVAVTRARVLEVMLQHDADPRALWMAWKLGDGWRYDLLERSAKLGYAPAQAEWSDRVPQEEKLAWAQKAEAQG
jgi:hypothetical protein